MVPIMVEREYHKQQNIYHFPLVLTSIPSHIPTFVDIAWVQENDIEVPLRRFTKQKRSTISNDYLVYLWSDYDINHVMDFVAFVYVAS